MELHPGQPVIFEGRAAPESRGWGLTVGALYFIADVTEVETTPLVNLRDSPGCLNWYLAADFRPLGGEDAAAASVTFTERPVLSPSGAF